MSALVDARGCLTPAGMAALQRAPVGCAPTDLAQHVAGCARCQARLLAAGTTHRPGETESGTGATGGAGRLWRLVAFMVAALLFALGALALVGLLQPPG